MTNTPPIRGRTPQIREFILKNVGDHPQGIAALTMREFDIKRQAVNFHLKAMVTDGLLEAEGQTRGRTYSLALHTLAAFTSPTVGLSEDTLWHERIASLMADFPPNVRSICYYGFTEMVNNVVDHAASAEVAVLVEANAAEISILVKDHGVGIFNKIRDHFQLDDERQAMLELAKGKLTTDPERHSGEGIFFTSRMFDDFAILSGHFSYITGASKRGGLLEVRDDHPTGTFVSMRISRFTTRTTQSVYDEFLGEEPDDELAFSSTLVPLRLARYEGEDLVSRSQAKRVMVRVENFRAVFLNFDGVDHIGQGFADEVFRVWQLAHPETNLLCENASAPVMRMVNRARRAADLPALHSRRTDQ